MSINPPEFEPGHEDETEDQPLDGRESQPVQEGSSDDSRTLDSLDPLRDAELLADELSGNEAQPGPVTVPPTDDSGLESDLLQDDPKTAAPKVRFSGAEDARHTAPTSEDEDRFDAG